MSHKAKIQIAAYILAGIGLFAVLQLGLLAALLVGLLIYHLVEAGTPQLAKIGVSPAVGKMLLLICVALVLVGAIGAGVSSVTTKIMDGGQDNIAELLRKMADVVESAKTHIPAWLQNYVPATVEDWQHASSTWLRDNARHLGVIGREVGMFFAQLIIGMVIGGMVALSKRTNKSSRGMLAIELSERAQRLSGAFRRIVFSQIRISALNTALTGIFLTLVLPVMGTHLPLTKTMIAVTFVVGLLPIIGNLISNTMIVLISLGVSLSAAIGSLVFLIAVHKLEYFVNARIIGSRIQSHAWELLAAMLVMEAAFGVPGVIAAPIYYAYLKDELTARGLV